MLAWLIRRNKILPFHNSWYWVNNMEDRCVCVCIALSEEFLGDQLEGLWCNKEFTDRHCPLTVKRGKGAGLNSEGTRSSVWEFPSRLSAWEPGAEGRLHGAPIGNIRSSKKVCLECFWWVCANADSSKTMQLFFFLLCFLKRSIFDRWCWKKQKVVCTILYKT